MTTMLSFLLFIKVFALFFALQIVFKNAFILFKSIKTHTSTDISDRKLLYLGLSIAYVFACIFV